MMIIRTYEKYAEFEIDSLDSSRTYNNSVRIQQRAHELINESVQIIDALKTKKAVRVPKVEGKEKTEKTIEECILGFQHHRFARRGKVKTLEKSSVQKNRELYPVHCSSKPRT